MWVTTYKYHPTLNLQAGNFSFISFYFRNSKEKIILPDVSLFFCSQLLQMSQQINYAFLVKRRKVSSAQTTATNFHSILIASSVRTATCYGLDCPGIESGGNEICHASRPALGQPSHHNGSRFFRRRHSGRSVKLTIHLILVPGDEWVGAIHLSPLCACIGLSWVDLYFCYPWADKRNTAEPYYAGKNFSYCSLQAKPRQWLVALFDCRSKVSHNLPLGQRKWTLKHIMGITPNYVYLSLASLHWRRRIEQCRPQQRCYVDV